MSSWIPVATFEVAGIPKGQPRPRACIRGRHAAVYNPETADVWRGEIILAAVACRPLPPIEAAVYVVVDFRYPAPKGKRASGAAWAVKKPDIDNALKVVLDALTDIGYWTDDALVVAIDARKTVAGNGEDPGATISVYREEE